MQAAAVSCFYKADEKNEKAVGIYPHHTLSIYSMTNRLFVFSSSGRKSPPMSATSSLISQSSPPLNPQYPNPSSHIVVIPETAIGNPINTSHHESQQVTSPSSLFDPLQSMLLLPPPLLPGFPMMKSSSTTNIRRKARLTIQSDSTTLNQQLQHSNSIDNTNNTNKTTLQQQKNDRLIRKRNQRYGNQAVELDRLKRENALLTRKLQSTEKRCTYLKDSRKELRAVAETNHHASIQAESSATKHSTISSTLALKYKNVQKVLNLVREEYDSMIEKTEQQRLDSIHMAGSMEQMSTNIRNEITTDAVCIMSLFTRMDLNGDGELEKHEIVKAVRV